MDPLASLIAACTTFVGSHFALSHPLRAPLVSALGAKGFQLLYSVVALASFAWIVLAFRTVPPAAPLWDGTGVPLWLLVSLSMLLGSVLLAGSFMGNPALPAPGAKALAAKGVHGVFHITRHPMMWFAALWALGHALVSPTPRVLALTAAVALLALVGSHLQDRKKAVLMGGEWAGWEAQTSYWPRIAGLAKAGVVPWLGGLALWLAATWAHGPLNGILAGIWRWLG